MSSALRKALLNLQMPGVNLVRAVQGPPRNDRSHLSEQTYLPVLVMSQWLGVLWGRGLAEGSLATYTPCLPQEVPYGHLST